MYKIVRMFHPDGRGISRKSRVIKSGLTLEEAQAHCKDPKTHGIDRNGMKYFDGYSDCRK
jgi:hypothetical protein